MEVQHLNGITIVERMLMKNPQEVWKISLMSKFGGFQTFLQTACTVKFVMHVLPMNIYTDKP